MDQLKAMTVFRSVVNKGSFTQAAQALGMSTVMVSKYIVFLEETLKTKLLLRTTRQMQVTEAGWAFYEAAKQALDEVSRAYEGMAHFHAVPQGRLRISAPMTLGSEVLAPLVAQFMRRYSLINVELVLGNQIVDLLEDGFDCVFRIGDLKPDLPLVAKPMMSYQMVICAAPEYLAEYGHPKKPQDLAQHRLLGHSTWTHSFNWSLRDGEAAIAWPTEWVLNSNDGEVLRQAALAGNGVMMQPEFLVAKDIKAGRLVALLAEHLPLPRSVHLLYLPDRAVLPKINCFVAFMAAQQFIA
ncbi:MAG: LysR family transcriptional regulator [Neisseriaceae bacterium]|nr:LysR family transcriptional regulator [Neisseriaceae bacterium]